MTPEEELACIVEEIEAYPRPVSSEDAQFQNLMQRRAELEDAVLSDNREDDKCS